MTVTTTSRRFGHTFRSHTLPVPWDPADPGRGTLDLYAREIIPDGGENLPVLIFLQGGPGNPSPRPTGISGWIAEVLKTHRLVLLDQRGTGRSGRIDAACPHIDAADLTERLTLLRADLIVEDCERLREHLGVERVSLYGQSFGGFCITTYLSRHPERVGTALLTGGLPTISRGIDDVYRATYTQLARRHRDFYALFDGVEDRIREVCHHLDNSDERLPTGERLSSRRLRLIGTELGRGAGFDTLSYLFEQPFHEVKGEKRLRRDFLDDVGARVSLERHPLYAVIHESIYGGTVPGATAWSAHRTRTEVDGFAEDADPRDRSVPFYLTGEHVYPWQFEEDPALIPFRNVAEDLAAKDDWPSLYDADAIASSPAVAAAAIYVDDIYVPMQLSLETAEAYRDLRPHITNRFQHDGIHHDGAGILGRLIELVRDH